jgi:hypothetical protein
MFAPVVLHTALLIGREAHSLLAVAPRMSSTPTPANRTGMALYFAYIARAAAHTRLSESVSKLDTAELSFSSAFTPSGKRITRFVSGRRGDVATRTSGTESVQQRRKWERRCVAKKVAEKERSMCLQMRTKEVRWRAEGLCANSLIIRTST